MSSKLQRFDFGALRDFRGPPVPPPVVHAPEEVLIPELPPEPTFSEAQLAEARELGVQEGYSEGVNAGIRQALAGADFEQKKAAVVILKLMEQMRALETRYAEILTQESANLNELILMICRKIAGEALDARSVDTIAALVTRCLPVLFSRPRLLIDVHPDRLKSVEERVRTLLREQHYEGTIEFRPNMNIGESDVLLDWGTGIATRDTAGLWQEIETLLMRVPLEMTFQETLKQQH